MNDRVFVETEMFKRGFRCACANQDAVTIRTPPNVVGDEAVSILE